MEKACRRRLPPKAEEAPYGPQVSSITAGRVPSFSEQEEMFYQVTPSGLSKFLRWSVVLSVRLCSEKTEDSSWVIELGSLTKGVAKGGTLEKVE